MFEFDLMHIVASLPGLILAFALHEYAHARVAVSLGDPTPRLMGRLTVNPISHIDPIGLLVLFLVQFGWAKPVIYNPYNFKDFKKGTVLVALAGPGANLVISFVALLIYALLSKYGMLTSAGIIDVLTFIVIININFAVFNMLPLPPLDGSRVVSSFLSGELAEKYQLIERYSFIIFIVLIMTPIFSYIIRPIASAILQIFSVIINILV